MYTHVQTALFHIHTYQGINVQFVISFLFYCISVLQIIKRKSKRSKHSGKNKLLHVHLLANCLASSEQRSCEDSINVYILYWNSVYIYIDILLYIIL